MWPAWQGARLANQSVQLIDKIQVITKQNEGHEEEKQKGPKCKYTQPMLQHNRESGPSLATSLPLRVAVRPIPNNPVL